MSIIQASSGNWWIDRKVAFPGGHPGQTYQNPIEPNRINIAGQAPNFISNSLYNGQSRGEIHEADADHWADRTGTDLNSPSFRQSLVSQMLINPVAMLAATAVHLQDRSRLVSLLKAV